MRKPHLNNLLRGLQFFSMFTPAGNWHLPRKANFHLWWNCQLFSVTDLHGFSRHKHVWVAVKAVLICFQRTRWGNSTHQAQFKHGFVLIKAVLWTSHPQHGRSTVWLQYLLWNILNKNCRKNKNEYGSASWSPEPCLLDNAYCQIPVVH